MIKQFHASVMLILTFTILMVAGSISAFGETTPQGVSYEMISTAAGATGGEVSSDVRVQVNGKLLTLDVQAYIKDGYTLIPFRGVFESLGGEVGWDQDALTATVKYDTNEVIIPIGSKTAKVNGAEKTMQISAEVVNDRTMIPLRFVSESLGFEVKWDDGTRTAIINSPANNGGNNGTTNPNPNPTPTPTPDPVIYGEINQMAITKGDSRTANTIITVSGTAGLNSGSGYTTLALTDPNRFVVDLKGFTVNKGTVSDLNYSQEDSAVTGVRASQMENDVTRLVVDLKEASVPVVTLSNDKKTMTVTFKRLSTYFKPMEDGKLVVMLDPGHGKSTGGKRSPDSSLMEYEFNRSVANKVKALLEAQGVEVLLTVSDDTDTSLEDRCKIANESNADIFVSIHANAFGNGEWNSATGWEVYHYEGATLANKLAKSIQAATIPASGMKDRGVKTANFQVIKNTYLPAVLIEHGFYTNEQEVELLKSDEWRNKMAQCDANGIMNFLRQYS